jgi:hypothetical protein
LTIRVTVWNEYRHERSDEVVRSIYPAGIHTTIADALRTDDNEVRTATLDEPEHGLTDAVLATTECSARRTRTSLSRARWSCSRRDPRLRPASTRARTSPRGLSWTLPRPSLRS